MSTETFRFDISDSTKEQPNNIKVENSQCEIEGRDETEDKFILIDAKNFYSNGFLVR